MLEKEIEKKSRENIEKDGGLLLKFVSPGWTGAPDRIRLLPGGDIVFMEFKQPGEDPTPIQKYRHEQLRRLGFKVEVIDYVIPSKTLPRVRHK